MKKIAIFLLSICAMFIAADFTACKKDAVDEPSTVTFEYVRYDDGFLKGYAIANLKGENIKNGVLTIPDSYMGEPIVSVGISGELDENVSHENHPSITKVVIPASVKVIRYYAFLGMKNLKEIEFAEGSRLETIQSYAFKNCSSLTSFSLPKTVENINATSFLGCTSLVEFRADNEYFIAIDGVLYNREQNELVCYPFGKKDKSYTVIQSATEIAPYAFYSNKNLESIAMPNVGILRKYAFADCANLSNVVADNLYGIENEALTGTAWLEAQQEERVVLGNVFIKYQGTQENVSVIGFFSIAPYAFKGNQTLKSVTISVRGVGDGAFMNCSALERVYIDRNAPTDIVYIGLETFDNNAENRTIILPHATLMEKYQNNQLWQPYKDCFEVLESTNE